VCLSQPVLVRSRGVGDRGVVRVRAAPSHRNGLNAVSCRNRTGRWVGVVRVCAAAWMKRWLWCQRRGWEVGGLRAGGGATPGPRCARRGRPSGGAVLPSCAHHEPARCAPARRAALQGCWWYIV